MKRNKKILPMILTVVMGLTTTFAFVSCDESYTTTETDAIISELRTKMESNQSELKAKIDALQEAYKAKDNELLAQIKVNQQSIATIQTEYAVKIAVLQQADETNAKAIADLKTEYLAEVEALANANGETASKLAELKTAYERKVSALQQADETNAKAIADLQAECLAEIANLELEIAKANTKIESNQTELNGAITALTETYETKMAQIDTLLQTLQNTDSTQDEKIAELVGKIAALEEATRITGVQFADNGDLIITFGDGSTQTVKAPEKHVHTVGEWTVFTDNDTPCEERLFFRVCENCHSVEWKQGEYSDHDFTIVTTAPTCTEQGYDTKTCEICGKVEIVNYTPVVPHPWATEYSEDNSYHWYDCTTCNAVKGKEEHTDDGSGNCSVCDYPIGPTAGIVYDVVDGKARVVGYEGTSTRVRIAETYQGVPVTGIGDYAFSYCRSLTTIEIPDGVTTIGSYAFAYCHSLTSIEIPDGVTLIGEDAFARCYSLTSIEIPDGVTSIGEDAFSNCDSLTSVVIGDSVTSIGSSAFYGCSSLTSVYYQGTAEEWAEISIGSSNDKLKSATRYYYSETQPTETGNYWHYDKDGNVVVW